MNVRTEAFADALQEWVALIDRSLDQALGDGLECPARLREAMRYSVFVGGKRLRPLLVLLACDACFGPIDEALPAAVAVEMVHAYSLIHDDLPAMDDDALRRGRPTCHRRFDEATAILAGDGLLTLAFETLGELKPSSVAIGCVRSLAQASGADGMVGGQVDDLNAADGPGTLEWLRSMHQRKTGALLTSALRMGGLVAGADDERLRALASFGERIGLAFQIADDLLDVEGDAERVGKGVRKDAEAGKLTYPKLLGVEESRSLGKRLACEARECLAPLGPAASRLATLADYVVERDR